jgi:hypothetical protein
LNAGGSLALRQINMIGNKKIMIDERACTWRRLFFSE